MIVDLLIVCTIGTILSLNDLFINFIINSRREMIRRVTPNKDFRGRSKSNCCAWLCSDATSNKSELRFTVCETDGK